MVLTYEGPRRLEHGSSVPIPDRKMSGVGANKKLQAGFWFDSEFTEDGRQSGSKPHVLQVVRVQRVNATLSSQLIHKCLP